MKILQPPGWAKPRGLFERRRRTGARGLCRRADRLERRVPVRERRFVGQFRQTLKNIVAVLAEAGGEPEHIVRMTWYITDKREYLARGKEVGAAFRELIGSYYAAMAAVQVVALMEDGAKVEIETTAVIPC